ncbi:MAG: DUF4412 domain-containing protein [Bacteroidota bacterium]|nr:DUF4412 domain-containing protein [Bacteroidota bacterium]
MKQTIITLFLSVCCLFTFAQSFEGQVVYQTQCKSKLPNVTDDQFTAMVGSTMNYYIKGGDYKSDTNGSVILWQLYINKENKLYNKFSSSEAVLYNDCAVNPDSVLSSELHVGVAEILGYKCDELILNCKTGVQKYYFSSKLPIDSKLYTNHKFGNWFTYLSMANAIPLKMVINNAQFSLETIATSVKPMKLDAVIFQLPAGITTAKSPY